MKKLFFMSLAVFSAVAAHSYPGRPYQHQYQYGSSYSYPNQNYYQSNAPRTDASIAGGLSYRMEKIDKEKLFKALDAPIGKETSWQNSNTGITYTLVATEKVEIEGNNLCRKYKITASRGGRRVSEVNRIACIDEKSGGWKPAG